MLREVLLRCLKDMRDEAGLNSDIEQDHPKRSTVRLRSSSKISRFQRRRFL